MTELGVQLHPLSDNSTLDQGIGNDTLFEKIEDLYKIAYLLYQEKQYLPASIFFRILVDLSPGEVRFRKGLGASLQMQKKYQEALDNYRVAQRLLGKQGDPFLYTHVSDCYFSMGDTDKGFEILKRAQKFALKTHNKALLHHIDVMNTTWNRS